MAGKMALQVRSLTLAVALSTLLCIASAQSSTSGCTTVIIGLAPCLGYISGNASSPSSSCCSKLSGVVSNQPQCLCVLLNGGASSFGLSINQTRALALPGACKVSTPPVSLCKAASGPTASPSTPAATPSTPSVPSSSSGAGTPETPSSTPSSSVPSSGGSKSTPSTGSGTDETSDGISYGSTSLLLIISVFMVAASTSFIQLPLY